MKVHLHDEDPPGVRLNARHESEGWREGLDHFFLRLLSVIVSEYPINAPRPVLRGKSRRPANDCIVRKS